jgi:membrane protein DedA with SNARE-associated domain
MLNEIINNISDFAFNLGYIWIFFMMVLESSFFPFPSEIAVIPAWIAISKWKMDFSLVLLYSTLWALVWATINYIIWYYLWWKKIEKLIDKYWKYFFIKKTHYEKAEKYFEKHWSITTFLARFISVIRQLISIPAWVFKMNFKKFLFYTWVWAWIWNIILILIGYFAWIAWNWDSNILSKYKIEMLIWWVIFIILVWYIYYLINKKKENLWK